MEADVSHIFIRDSSSLSSGLFPQTSEEVLEKMTGLLVPLNDQRNVSVALSNSIERLPTHLDYRKKGIVTAVKDQVRRARDWNQKGASLP